MNEPRETRVTGTMTVASLMLALQGYDRQMPVLISIDGEGNDYKPIVEADVSDTTGYATAPFHGWIISTYSYGDDGNGEEVPEEERAVVIWPVN